ncbi:hypothetical protein EYC84_004916 [Monilinia fructicola]|uniref:Uncharacterized protein n=1 Tax=Monilinia fructicola TaxID=38448 RepID=A0A5M9KA95_MONFR|nr:hypothetical protein EYC84_004916 [Monilinia fructicola]
MQGAGIDFNLNFHSCSYSHLVLILIISFPFLTFTHHHLIPRLSLSFISPRDLCPTTRMTSFSEPSSFLPSYVVRFRFHFHFHIPQIYTQSTNALLHPIPPQHGY